MELPPTDEAAIHRLVDDILAYIFFLNATAPDSNSSLRVRHATTVASSQVCMRWRSIALHCHTIWGPIIDYPRHSLKWIETLLDRSHPSSLDIGSRINTVYGEQGVLELVFNHIDRLRMANLKVSASSWELVCSRFLQLPVPNLEFVNVTIAYTHGTLQLTHPLFNHYAPKLRNLQLGLCMVDFTSPILTRLTKLYVTYIADSSAVPTVLDWLNILGGMPSLRWVTLIRAISSATTNDIYPIIHLAALEMLSVDDGIRESVTLVEHLIAPSRCGLRLCCRDAYVEFYQRKIWSLVEKRRDSWTKNAPFRYLEVLSNHGFTFALGNLHQEIDWVSEAEDKQYIHLADPVMDIALHNLNPQDTFSLLSSMITLFECTFFDTTNLKLRIDYDLDIRPDVFLPLLDMFRGFVNLKELCLECNSSFLTFLPLLQHTLPNSVLFPALQSIRLSNTVLRPTTTPLFRVEDFLRWRGEQGFPVQKIHISSSRINRQYVLTHIQVQDTIVDIDDGSNYDDSEWVNSGDEEED